MLFPQVMVSSFCSSPPHTSILISHPSSLSTLSSTCSQTCDSSSVSSSFSLLWVCRGDPFYAERSHDTVVKNVVNCAACVLALTLAGVNTFERVNLA